MKFLVTGSSGFIGYHLVSKLLEDGHKVIGVDNHNDYYDISLKEHRKSALGNTNYKFYQQDLNRISISENKIDVAINLAAQAGVRVSKDREYLYDHSNIKGFKNFCNFCRKKSIKRIIYASSSSVYSDSLSKKLTESESKIEPKSKYGFSKLSNENFASDFSRKNNISTIGLRFFSVYGPFGRPDMAYYLFTEALKKNTSILLNNEGKMSRDMTYIDDIVDGIIGAIDYLVNNDKKITNEIFNLGNDCPITTYDLLQKIEKKLNKKAKIINNNTKNEAKFTHADITKAKNLLGYQPKVSFDKGLDNFLNWHKNYEKK